MYWSSSCSPVSSPASSPSPFVDSSPPSSPSIEFTEFELDNSPTQDPFAASAKATKLPRLYEKKRAISPSPISQVVKRSRFDSYEAPDPSDFPIDTTWAPSSIPVEADRTEDLFDDALNEIYDKSCGQVDLSSKGLTHIPIRFLEGLKNFVALPARSELDYADLKYTSRMTSLAGDNNRSFGRTASSASESDFRRTRSLAISSGAPREEIHLLLSNNGIRSLPSQIFDVERLTVLSLRGNKLTHLPPEISRLKSLRTLNIANNELKFLPSEILSLNLTILQSHPNPFIPSPSDSSPTTSRRTFSRSKTSKSQLFEKPRHTSPVHTVLPGVTPLSELCLRFLFSSNANNETLLSSHYALPIDDRYYSHPFPPSVRHCLHVGHPNCLVNYPGGDDISSPPTSVTGIGVCPSPRHSMDEKKPIFFMHSEERFTWESTIAGVNSLGGVVPIRWRGCQPGCLDFLDAKEPVIPAPSSSSGAESAVEDAEIIQPVQVTLGAFTMDEFGD